MKSIEFPKNSIVFIGIPCFFNVLPLGPAGERAKSRFFALSDPNWTGVGKPSFCQRARLVGVTRSTEGSFDSYPTPSVRIPQCLGARGPQGGTEIAKAKRRQGVHLHTKFIEILTQAFRVFI